MAVTKKQADETRWTLGKETDATGSPIQDRTDLVQRSYVATSFAVDENGDKAASDSLRAGFSDTFGELSGLWGDGGITMEVPEGEGLLPIMEGLLGDTAPVSTAQPNKTLVPAATLLTTVTDATTLYFQATGDTTVNVVDAAALNAAITIANNLSEYDTAQALTVTPSADPDNTGADIVINYTDGDGISQSGTLSFDDDTAQTFDLPANSTITSVTATAADWTSSQTLTITTPILTVTVRSPNFNRPGRLHFVFSAAVPNVETIRVKGLRKVGISTKDWLLMDETVDFGTDVTSDKYFMRILSIELLDADGDTVTATTETLTLTSEPGGYATVVKVADAILPNYTIEAEVADVPRLITGAKFVGGTINNEGTLNVELDVLAERVDRRRTVESGFAEKFTSTMEDNPTEFPEVSIGFFTGVGGYLESLTGMRFCLIHHLSLSLTTTNHPMRKMVRFSALKQNGRGVGTLPVQWLRDTRQGIALPMFIRNGIKSFAITRR